MGASSIRQEDERIASAVRSAVARYCDSRSRSNAELGTDEQDLMVKLALAVLAECEPLAGGTREFGGSSSAPDSRATVDDVGQPPKTGDLDFHVTTGEAAPAGPPGYEILGKLGAGGMGIVYKARDIDLKRVVALKMVLAGGHATAEQLARFVAEAQAVAKLDHPNLVRVYDIGEHARLPYFAMEYVDGGALNQRVRKESMDPKVAAKLMEAVARGVHYAHTRKIIHRDLKPANVLLTADGTPKVTDFGLAKQLDEIGAAGATQTGLIMGTPSYMAPEQAEGRIKDVDERADIYSLGATLYELLTGRPPFQAPNSGAILAMVRTAEPVPPRRLQPGVPRDLETICLKCLHKEPPRRYATAEELADDLKRFLNGEPIKARPVGQAERFVRWCRRKPTLAGLTLASALLAVSFVVSLVVYSIRLADKNDVINKKNGDLQTANIAIDKKNVDLQTANSTLEAKDKVVRAQAELSADEVRYVLRVVGAEYFDQGLTKQRMQLVQHFLDYTKRIARVNSATAGIIDRSIVSSHIQLGEVCLDLALGDKAQEAAMRDDADAHFAQAVAAARDLVKREPDSNLARADLALALNAAAFGKIARNDAASVSAAAPFLNESEVLRQAILDAPPSPAGAPDAIRRADALQALATTYFNRYLAADRERKPALAATCLNRSNDLRRGALKEAEKDPEGNLQHDGVDLFQMRLAQNLWPTVELAARGKKLPEARALAKEAVELAAKVVKKNPDNTEFQRQLAKTLQSLARAELLSGDYATSATTFDDAIARSEAVIERAGPSPGRKSELASGHYGAGLARQLNLDKAAAAKHFRTCVEIRRELAADMSRVLNAAYQRQLMVALARAGDTADAIAVVRDEVKRANEDKKREPERANFDAACVYSILAEQDEARRAEFIELSWHHVGELFAANAVRQIPGVVSDPDMAYLRKQPDFERRFAELRKKLPTKK